MRLFKFIKQLFEKKKKKLFDPYQKNEFNFVEKQKDKTIKHLTEDIDYKVYYE